MTKLMLRIWLAEPKGDQRHLRAYLGTVTFCFIGPSTFRLYLWDSRKDSLSSGLKATFDLGEDNPVLVVVPKGVVHAYRNIGAVNGIVYNAPNRLYAGEGHRKPVDEIRHEDDPGSPFALD